MNNMTVEQLCDWLYRVGYIDAQKERDYDPRSCRAWAEVHKTLAAPMVPYGFMRADQIEGIALNVERGYGGVFEVRTTKDNMFSVPLYTTAPAPDDALASMERNSYDKIITDQDAKLAAAESRVRELEANYSELLYQVHEIIGGQTRHQTALARLRSWNERSNEPVCNGGSND